jgi:hypothetical protein
VQRPGFDVLLGYKTLEKRQNVNTVNFSSCCVRVRRAAPILGNRRNIRKDLFRISGVTVDEIENVLHSAENP